MSSLLQQILFYLAIVIILFLPGYSLLLAVFGKSENHLSQFERFVFSFGLGIVITDFIAFAYSGLNVPITAFSSIFGSVVFSFVCFGIYRFFVSKASKNNSSLKIEQPAEKNDLFYFSRNQFFLLLIFLFLAIFIRTAYLTGTVAPTSTDMGHHLYWTKDMVETNKLPDYEGMPDFIIGEHITLAEITMISGQDLFGASPVIYLFLINILGILTVFLLTLRIFKNKNIAVLSILFLGVLFAISSPQAKFVSGGVMGNILGNFLMPLAFYFYYRAFEFLDKKNVEIKLAESSTRLDKSTPRISNYCAYFLSLAVFITFGLFYTHHLTAFIFLFIFAFLVIFFLAINFKSAKKILRSVLKIVFSKPVILTMLVGIIFFFFVFTPNYAQTNAVETAVGTPSKATREGLSLTNLKDSAGEARMALGILGAILLALAYRKKNFGYAIVFSWTAMLFIMSTAPNLLFINLPSNRIGNYITYPLAILSAFGLYSIFKPENFRLKNLNGKNSTSLIPQKFLTSAFLLVFTFVLGSGLGDSAASFKKSSDFTPTLETFEASRYLAKKISPDENLLKDHNYLSGDTWMKLFFMREYRFPLSRSYFKRYEDPTKPREMCTLWMISVPGGEDAKKCFLETGVKYIVVNPNYDSSQFSKLKNFDAVYNSGEVAVYYRK